MKHAELLHRFEEAVLYGNKQTVQGIIDESKHAKEIIKKGTELFPTLITHLTDYRPDVRSAELRTKLEYAWVTLLFLLCKEHNLDGCVKYPHLDSWVAHMKTFIPEEV